MTKSIEERALAKWFRHAKRGGYQAEQPSRNGVHVDFKRRIVTIRNSRGVLARYRYAEHATRTTFRTVD